MRSLLTLVLLAVPASAEFTTYSGADAFSWFTQSTYFTVQTFDALASPVTYGGAGGANLGGVHFDGYTGQVSWTNAWLYVQNEGVLGTGYNYGGVGNVLMSSSTAGVAGFRILLPNPVTFFGVEIMGPYAGRSVTVAAGTQTANGVFNPLVGTVTTLSNRNRNFFGFSSATPFTTIDITGAATGNIGNLVIDDMVYGNTPEPQPAICVLAGLGAMLLARRRVAAR
jgi:hypothetical protein